MNGRIIPRGVAASARLLGEMLLDDRAEVAVRFPRKRKPAAVGWVARSGEPLGEAERGVAISTLG
ncbi:MAG TPA: hypothetical protein VMM12_01695, partial [Longimicrobiales bacterium]|nr:hypothetical protein [Longimicrobiales bacterium]